MNGFLDIVVALIKENVPVDAKDTHGNTALIYGINLYFHFNLGLSANFNKIGACKGFVDIVDVLIKANANINSKNTGSYTALIWCMFF